MDRNYKCAFFYFFEAIVALRKESVDRNRRKVLGFPCKQFRVALRKESVDRNNSYPIKYLSSGVALRKESVDRNFLRGRMDLEITPSLSARRAWIEIVSFDCKPQKY